MGSCVAAVTSDVQRVKETFHVERAACYRAGGAEQIDVYGGGDLSLDVCQFSGVQKLTLFLKSGGGVASRSSAHLL